MTAALLSAAVKHPRSLSSAELTSVGAVVAGALRRKAKQANGDSKIGELDRAFDALREAVYELDMRSSKGRSKGGSAAVKRVVRAALALGPSSSSSAVMAVAAAAMRDDGKDWRNGGLFRELIIRICPLKTKPTLESAEARTALVQFVCSNVIASKQKVPSRIVSACVPLLKGISQNQKDEIIASCARAILRNPEVAARTVKAVFRAIAGNEGCGITLTDIDALFPPIVSAAKNSMESSRQEARCVMRAIGECIYAADVLTSAVKRIIAVLEGKEGGKLTQWQHRVGVLGLLAELASASVSPAAKIGVADTVLAPITGVVKSESNNEARIAGIETIGQWYQCSGSAPEATLAFVLDGMGEKDEFRRAAYPFLLATCQSQASAQQLEMFLSHLSDSIEAGLAKVVSRSDGMTAAAVLFSHAATSKSAAKCLADKNIFDKVMNVECPFFYDEVWTKADFLTCKSLIILIDSLVTHHSWRVSGGEARDAYVSNIFASLVGLGFHHDKKVRKEALSCLSRLVNENIDLVGNVSCRALQEVLRKIQRSWQKSGTLNVHDEYWRASYNCSRIARVVTCILPKSEPVSAEHLARCILLLNYPLARGYIHIMQMEKRMFKSVDKLRVRMNEFGERFASILAGEWGATSCFTAECNGALASFEHIAGLSPNDMTPVLLQEAIKIANVESHESLIEDDITIYYTGEDTKAIDYSMRATLEADNPVKRRARDPALVEIMKHAEEKTKNTFTKETTLHEQQRLQQLAGESAIRQEIEKCLVNWNLAMEIVSHILSGYVGAGDEHIATFSAIILPFLQSEIVELAEGTAFVAATRLADCIISTCSVKGDTKSLAILVASASKWVRKVKRKSSQIKIGTPLPVESTLSFMYVSQIDHPFEANSFAFLLPVLDYALVTPAGHIACASPAPSRVTSSQSLASMGSEDSSQPNTLVATALSILTTQLSSADATRICSLPVSNIVHSLQESLKLMAGQRNKVGALLRILLESAGDVALLAALKGLTYAERIVREVTLAAMCQAAAVTGDQDVWDDDAVNTAIWMCKHDVNEDVQSLASRLYEGLDYELPENYLDLLAPELGCNVPDIRTAACDATSAGIIELPETCSSVCEKLMELYRSGLSGGPRIRHSVAKIFTGSGKIVAGRHFMPVMTFLLREALIDSNSSVYDAFLETGPAILNAATPEVSETFVPFFQLELDKDLGVGAKRSDRRKGGAMPMLGAAASHYEKGDPRIAEVINSMISVLSTPSEAVQKTVADTLVPLMSSYAASSEEAMPELVGKLLQTLTTAERYGDRRGAAFGLAATAKGCGIGSLKKFGSMDALKIALDNKKDLKAREGALMAFECLCNRLGRLFEPYVIHILPGMLVAMGDGSKSVREAAEGTAKAIMKNLSAQGVKLVLPSLMQGLESKTWRTKQGSVQMLGAMAFCAPKQLSNCLPQIVPQLSEILGDTHPKVQAAAREALEQVGSVIKNPEVQVLVPSLLAAIADPAENTKQCIDDILEAVFAHTLDPPSLSLLVPVVTRGMRERTTAVKNKAVTIVSNMCSLISDPKDLGPYIDVIMVEMKKVLVDPIPEMRAIAAKAVAMLVSGIGLDQFEDFLVWLRTNIKENSDSVERSGAAQGLAEIIGVLDETHLDNMLPTIVEGCRSMSVYEREGSILMLAYLPLTLHERFAPHLTETLPCVLKGLADDNDGVREVSLQAGKVYIRQFAMNAQELLINAILSSAFNSSWRIRHASVQLLGDLLFMVAGVTGRIQTNDQVVDDADSVSSETNTRAIETKLGTARRDATLSAIYILRSDSNLQVRQSALHIWKSVVASTPKTILEIVGVLLNTILEGLASDHDERQSACNGALSDIVRKLGERVLPSIVPLFSEMLHGAAPNTRVGVCAGVLAVVMNSSKTQLHNYLPKLLPVIRDALCDSDEGVREAAGSAFGGIVKVVGSEVLAEVVPLLLQELGGSEAEKALDGLRQVIRIQPQVLKDVLPTLTEGEMTASKATAIGALSGIAPGVVAPSLKEALPPLLRASGSEGGEASEGIDIREAASNASLSVVGAVSVQAAASVVNLLTFHMEIGDSAMKKGCATTIARAVTECSEEALSSLEEHYDVLLRACITQFFDGEEGVYTAAWTASGKIVSAIPKESLPEYVTCVQEALSLSYEYYRRRLRDENSLASAQRSASGVLILPALSLPKALQPLLPVYLGALLSGESPEIRESAANALAELIPMASFASLKPSVVAITGPLIRIFGERFPWEVKAAVLSAIQVLVKCASLAVKPFLPQLQATFLKCQTDSAVLVRERAGVALGSLLGMSTRVDPVVNELLNGISSNEHEISTSMVCTLRWVLENAGQRVSQDLLSKAYAVASSVLADNAAASRSGRIDEATQASMAAAASLVGLCARHLQDSDPIIRTAISTKASSTGAEEVVQSAEDHRHVLALSTAGVLRYAADKVCGNAENLKETMTGMASCFQEMSDRIVKLSAIRGWEALATQAPKLSENATVACKALFKYFKRLLKDGNMEIRQKACDAIVRSARSFLLFSEERNSDSNAKLSSSGLGFICEAVAVLAQLSQETSPAMKHSAEVALYYCLGLSDGDTTRALEYIAGSSPEEKKILTQTYVGRLVETVSRRLKAEDMYDSCEELC